MSSTSEPQKSKESLRSDGDQSESDSLLFPQIKCMEHVIANFFNQIVQYVIEDMIVLEPKLEMEESKIESEVLVKEYKQLKEEDLSNADVTSASGSKIILSRRTSSGSRKMGKSPNNSKLKVILEEISDQTLSRMSTISSSLNDPLMEEEREVKIIFNNGNVYEGRIAKRIMNGKGRYVWTDGTVYEGDFKDGFPTGKGAMTLPDLSHYEGEFNHGLFHGHGFLNIVATPTFYSGQWKDGLKHGEGWLLYEPGDWYEGGWTNDLKHGLGVRHYKNGAKYRGTWSEGKYDGEGVMIWENNDYYKGGWQKGAMHGDGEYIWKAFYNTAFAFPIQNIYRGSWENGKRCGEGTMLFGDDSGMKLTGWWDQDFKHGDGCLVCGNGRVLDKAGLFYYDKPLQTETCSTWSLPSAVFYRVLEVPIFSAPEFVDVGFYVEKVLDKLQDVSVEKLRLLKAFEEKCVRNTIIRFLPQLKELYQDYATMAVRAQLHYQPVLVRLFLWQLYKDTEVSKYGLSLAETDEILAQNPASSVETVHDALEPIYFWQFLMSLIGVALTTSRLEEIYDSSPQGGVSAFVVKKFLDEVILAKPPDHQGCLFLNYLDMAPFKSVYLLYRKIGEPHTARTFLKASCTKKGEAPFLCLLDFDLQKAEAHFGANLVPLGHYVNFEQIGVAEFDERMKHKWSSLFDFRHLGARNIIRCLSKVCPLIMDEDLVVNIDYPLTFLEFYETLLTCIFMVLELEMKKERKILEQDVAIRRYSGSSKARSSKTSESKKGKVEKKAGKKKKKKND